MRTLDGITILRFAQIFKSGGGIESQLEDLDQILLKRNKMKIIRLYLEKGSNGEGITKKEIGKGSLIEVPLIFNDRAFQSKFVERKIIKSIISFFKKIFRESVTCNQFLYHIFFQEFIKKYYLRFQDFGAQNAGEEVRKIFKNYKVDLVVMHDIGGIDSGEIIEEAKKFGIPYIFINHFSNDRLNNISVREQLNFAEGIAGVTSVGIPRWIKGKFYNLSDGIDTEIFNPSNARTINIEKNIPIIIYPARIIRVKGQKDLIKAVANLRDDGLRAKIVFAGRSDSPEYEKELKKFVSKKKLTGDVLFLGQINREELRDWYGVSTIMAFPTYHQEGLPRIIIEAQAMKVPPVAYIIGGTPEAIQDGKTGFLVRKGDIKTFAQKLHVLLTNEELRKKMAEEGRRFVQKNFNLGALAERHELLYTTIIEKFNSYHYCQNKINK